VRKTPILFEGYSAHLVSFFFMVIYQCPVPISSFILFYALLPLKLSYRRVTWGPFLCSIRAFFRWNFTLFYVSEIPSFLRPLLPPPPPPHNRPPCIPPSLIPHPTNISRHPSPPPHNPMPAVVTPPHNNCDNNCSLPYHLRVG
jgi:hypothetical protein